MCYMFLKATEEEEESYCDFFIIIMDGQCSLWIASPGKFHYISGHHNLHFCLYFIQYTSPYFRGNHFLSLQINYTHTTQMLCGYIAKENPWQLCKSSDLEGERPCPTTVKEAWDSSSPDGLRICKYDKVSMCDCRNQGLGNSKGSRKCSLWPRILAAANYSPAIHPLCLLLFELLQHHVE